MTKKDFEKIACSIKDWSILMGTQKLTAEDALRSLVVIFCLNLEKIGQDFNKDEFIKKCGL